MRKDPSLTLFGVFIFDVMSIFSRAPPPPSISFSSWLRNSTVTSSSVHALSIFSLSVLGLSHKPNSCPFFFFWISCSLSPSIHPPLPLSLTDCAGRCIFGRVVSRNRLLWMARSLGLIKNGEMVSEVHFLFSSSGHLPSALECLHRIWRNSAWQSPTSHYILHRTVENQNSGQAH